MAKTKYKSMHMAFSPDLYEKINEHAQRENRTLKNAVETILLNHFKNEEK